LYPYHSSSSLGRSMPYGTRSFKDMKNKTSFKTLIIDYNQR
jgi:hypothetical protein